MKISIEYCSRWNYKPEALRVRELLVADLESDIELIPGDSGVFDIKHNDILLYSKHTTGRFPNDAEINDMINSLSQRQ